jgi:hypothetical protein
MSNLLEKIKNFMTSKKFMVVLMFAGLFLLVTGISLAAFTYFNKNSVGPSTGASPTPQSRVDLSLPKTEACPINGAMFNTEEKAIWEKRRPLAAMVENHVDSRPQSGLSKADMIYEAVAEGGITRFLAVYYCAASAAEVRIGPVRSARVHFINWAVEFGGTPLFLHVGEANNICNNCPGGVKTYGTIDPRVDALKLLEKIGWSNGTVGNDMNGETNLGYPAIKRDPERIPGAAYEHTVMGFTDEIFDAGVKRGFAYNDSQGVAWNKTFVPWTFVDGKIVNSPNATDINIEFVPGMADYKVEWKFDSANNQYLRFNGGKPHIDMDTQKQLTAKNVVIQYAKMQDLVDKEYHVLYTVVGTGKALVFQNGTYIAGTWSKDDLTARTKFFDNTGKEISLVRGVSWIEVVPTTGTVNYQ